MFDSERPDAYEKVYEELVERLASAELEANAGALGLEWHNGEASLVLYGRRYRVGAEGVTAEDGGVAQVAHRIVLAHYLMHGGRGEPSRRFVPYREIPGGCDFSRNLSITVEGRVASFFAGKRETLIRASEAIGGTRTEPETSCDAAFVFEALPKVPIMFTFYDEDDDFPAEVKVFFDALALHFLDLECLAVVGMLLASELEEAANRDAQI